MVIKCKEILTNLKKQFTTLGTILSAKKKNIVKCFYVQERIRCDISFDNTIGLCYSRFVSEITSLNINIRPNLMSIKYVLVNS